MNTTAPSTPSNETTDVIIETLLGGGDSVSIVDVLFSLPEEDAASTGSAEWARAVQSRLQARLVERMRRMIDVGDDQASSAA